MSDNKISIQWKLFFYFSCFSLIMLVLLWVFQIVLLDDFYRTIKTGEIKSYSNMLAQNIDEILSGTNDFSDINHDICVSIFDNWGNIIYISDVSRTCLIHRMPSNYLYALSDEVLQNRTEYIDQLNDVAMRNPKYGLKNIVPSNILFIREVVSKNGNQYTFVLNSAVQPVAATVTTLRTQLIYVTIIMIVLSFLMSIRISKSLSKPIIEISDKSKEFAKGNYDVNFNGNDYKEIQELVSSLNYSAKELSKTDKLRQELIANISHDLRTPLTMITGYAEVMRDLPEENTPENVQVIIDEAKRLTSLVNDVLDISKLQAGVQTLNKTEFNLTKCIEEILDRYSKLTEKDGYNIIFEKDKEIFVNADELKISQVIYNLINNAITYTGDDKKITIRQTNIDGKIKIEVIDTGDGIAEENIPYIWERYYKVSEHHRRAQIGTGLGLSIVKSILILHEAEFGVESKVGEGSNFWFVL